MTKYIDTEKFEKEMYHEAFETDSDMQKWDSGCWIRYKLFKDCLEKQPTADVVKVVHGEWEPHYETFDEDKAVGLLGGEYQTGWKCSVCGRYEPSKEPYCNCGAKMDGKKVE